MQINLDLDLCCDANTVQQGIIASRLLCIRLGLAFSLIFHIIPTAARKPLSSSEKPQFYTLITHMTTKPHVQECDFHGVTHIKPPALPPSALSSQQYVIVAQL